MKGDTRIEGPWTEKDMADPPVLTRQIKEFQAKEMHGWQKGLINMISVEDDRSIIFIYDTKGNSGKSIFAEYLEYKQLAFKLPMMRSFEDIMQFGYYFPDQKCYLIDMPRAMKKDKLSEFYSGIECLKNGLVWGKRYTAKKRRMDRPQIVVFSNSLPAWDFMSPDRWSCWLMTDNKCLRSFQPS